MTRIDFNCDLGEGCGDDAAIVARISSASIAAAPSRHDSSMRATCVCAARTASLMARTRVSRSPALRTVAS